MQSFVHGPTRVVFGRGSSLSIRDLLSPSWKRIAVITTERGTGAASVVASLSRSRSIEIVHLPIVRANPDLADLETALVVTREVDALIAVGGGSVLDTGKALRVMSMSDNSPRTWLDNIDVRTDTEVLPLVAVPTTFGSGSEVSFGAILSDRARSVKRGIRGVRLAPDIAVVDSQLAEGTPHRIAVLSGFDTLAHAMESMVSRKASEASRALSWSAMRVVGSNLLDAARGQPSAQDAISFASTMMGINLAHVGTCLPHRMQYAIGGAYPQCAHSEVLAWLYPAWIERLWHVAQPDVVTFVEALGGQAPLSATRARRELVDWFERVGVPFQPTIQPRASQLVRSIEGDLSVDPLSSPNRQALEILSEVFS